MTTRQQTAPASVEIESAPTSSVAVNLSRLVETAPVPKPPVWLFASGLTLSGLLSSTATTTPIAESQVRYIGSWTSTARTVDSGAGGGGARLSSQSRSAEGGSSSTASVAAEAERSGAAAASGAGADRATQAAEVRWLREASGLTWEQLGRLFGVSRRAVRLWANGGRMNASNAETLGQLVALVRQLPGGPEQCRAALLAPTEDGSSIVNQYRARHRSDTRDVSGTPFRPDELLGARHDDTAQK